MLNYIVLFFFLIINGGVVMSSAQKSPKEFFLCHRSDPDFKTCLGQAVENSIRAIALGNEELGVPVLNRLKVSNINIEGHGGPIHLTQHYTDCVISDPTDRMFTYAEAAFKKDYCYIHLKSMADVLTVACQYDFKGKLLLFQLHGHGHSNITLLKMSSWHNITCNIYEKNGNEFLNITDWTEEFSPENVLYDFDNLVDGNAEISAQVLQVMNDNAMNVFEYLRVDYEKVYAEILKQMANNVFGKIPWKNIFLE